ncbi:unnamed protein product, partial [Protopolystoma xenopodis]
MFPRLTGVTVYPVTAAACFSNTRNLKTESSGARASAMTKVDRSSHHLSREAEGQALTYGCNYCQSINNSSSASSVSFTHSILPQPTNTATTNTVTNTTNESPAPAPVLQTTTMDVKCQPPSADTENVGALALATETTFENHGGQTDLSCTADPGTIGVSTSKGIIMNPRKPILATA